MSIAKFVVVLAALAGATAPVAAQEWPTRPLVMVVPYAAGGTTDVIGRILAARLSEVLRQTVIIE
ncbi:MAG TPA: tripartite tricarboxylate transporter substrate binding protein, partial [Xanthobacteraceae bacterium]